MSNLKISQLTPGNPALGGDLLPIDRSGANFSVSAASLAALGTSSFAQAGVGGFWAAGKDMQILFGESFTSGPIVCTLSGFQIIVWQFTTSAKWTISTASLFVTSGSGGGSSAAIGIYDSNLNLVLDSGVFTIAPSESQTAHKNTISPVTFGPGTFYFAAVSSTQNNSYAMINLGASIQLVTMMNNSGSPLKVAFSSVVWGGGALPSNLGTLSTTTVNQCNMPAAFFGV